MLLLVVATSIPDETLLLNNRVNDGYLKNYLLEAIAITRFKE